MKRRSFFIGREAFESEEGIKDFMRRSRQCDPQKEDPGDSDALMIFQTLQQQTWLVSSKERLYCILDDIRKDEPHINWSMPKSQLVSGGDVTVGVVGRESRKSGPSFGVVDIGPKHKNWLYSQTLFTSASVEDRIRDLIRGAMI